ncbi:Protein kinase [Sorangium cellulosum So ce56]|uniref:Protein kinase n=1 Tax=Sorangium cellulosum (strain So ce56) TaxID=448385 RepID=A9ETG2_SORC5|nr:serine/threonine-protein kinase [Sorangium cellulosum]CAN91005.1 Protein kinase [Sorangium cellulosum So ce56]
MALDRPPGAGSASRLGNYELLRELSGGGIGSTWLARASSDEGEAKRAPPVTILRIYRHLTKKTETADSILREAGMAQQVRFPNVLSVLDARIADGEVFIVSEYVEGEPLGALVPLAGAEGLPPPVSLRIAIDVLRALASAHTAQPAPLVHGELNPTHVSVGIDGVTRVGGLGVARAIAGLAPMGTRNPDRLAYAAPERVKAMAAHAEAPLDPRADLFSIGVVLWELLARQRLFSSKLEAAVIQKVQSAPIPQLAGLAGGAVPAEVVDVVQTALERDPARRFASASAMLAALEAAGAGRIAGDEDVAAAVSRLAGKTIEPRRTMIAAAMASPAGADEPRPPPRARGMTLVGVAIPAADGALSPRGDSPRQPITAPSPRARAATPGAPPVAAGGAIAASQVRPTSGATATKDAAAPKNGLGARPAAGAGASNGAGPAGTDAAHASVDTGWGSVDDVPARDLPGPRRPAQTLPRIELSGQGTEDRAAAGASTEHAAATGAATAKGQPPARPAAPRPGDLGDPLGAARATPTPAEGTAPKPPTPALGGPSPRPPRPPPPARAASPAQPETHGKVAAASPAAVVPALAPSPPTPRVPVPPPAAATRRTPVVPAVAPAPRAAATPAPPLATATSRAPATPPAPLPPAAPAPAASAEPSQPLPPVAPASATAPATPVAAKTPPPPPAAAAAPSGTPATQEGARGNGPASTSSRTVATPTGMQGPNKLWGRAASAVDQLGPGSTLGRYEILMPVAKGGMAAVWAARLQGTRGFRKIVAIKTMLPDVSDDPDFESMFLDEARVAARIRHPNVVEILDLGEEDDVLYIVMEWVDGETAGTLQKAAKRLGGIPQRIVLRIASQICAGLHNAHELRDDSGVLLDLVHRDISPANVLISTAGFVKIVDFGVAKSKGRLHVTRAGGIVKGKTPYLSPEQLGGLPIDRRSDIFSLGALLYVLTTGLHPFRAETELATIENITIKNPLPPRELNGAIHPELDRIILKALEKDPESRFSTCAEMQRAIDQVASTLGEPTTDEDVAAFVRQAIGEIQSKRAQELRDAIAAVDAGAAVNSERRPGAPLEGHAALADVGAGSREGGPAAAAGSPLAAAAPAGAGPSSSRGAASPAAEKDDEPPVSLEPISFEEIAVPAQPAGVPPRLIIAPALQADVAPGEPGEPVSPRPAAREGKPLGSSAKRILPAAGVPATKVLAAADPPASRAAALSERLARRGSRSLANDVGEVTAVDRSFETGERRKRLQLIVAGAAMFCVALGAVALVVRGGDERSRPEIGKARVDALPAAAPADTTAAAAEAVPAAPASPAEPQAAEPASPPAPEASATPPEAAPAPSPTPPEAAPAPSQTAKAPAAATAQPIAVPQASRPPSTARPRTTSTPAKPAPKPATSGKPIPKKKYNPSGI